MPADPPGSIPSSPLTTSSQLARNLMFSVAAQGWSIVLSLVAIRVVVHGLGSDAYGIFVIASLVLGYGGFLDLGLTSALIRSIAVRWATGDRERLERLIGTAFAALLGLGATGGLLLAALTPFAVGTLFHIPVGLQADARFVFYLAAAAFAINMALLTFAAIPQGLQRLDLLSLRNVALTTSTTIGQIIAIKLGGGLRWLAVVSFASNIASLAVFGILAPRLLPKVNFTPRLAVDALGELAGFGLRRFVSQVAVQATFQLDRIIVGAFLPIRAVTFYSVPLSITQRFLIFHGSITNTYFPAASELHSLGDTTRMRRLYLTTFKLNAVLMLMLVALIAGLAHPILDAWLGTDFARESSAILVVLALAYGLTALVGVSGQLTDASGHPGWTAAFVVVGAIVNLVLTIVLVPRVGAIGAAYALVFQAGAVGIVFLALVQQRLLALSLLETITVLARPALAATATFITALLLAPHLHGISTVLAGLVAEALLFAGLTILLGIWTRTELQLGMRTAAGAIRLLRIGRRPPRLSTKSGAQQSGGSGSP